ncbi:hypothetical protein SAY87_029366 [Trapa incisa]|uniref:RING-type domain-containing protein n=1 Tax=Trapa incisa TaxID=236973 RepID=A0AAN7KCR2_9MYRT|nr:hypothetical protein SAY87_029366 [Trapa incisa]
MEMLSPRSVLVPSTLLPEMESSMGMDACDPRPCTWRPSVASHPPPASGVNAVMVLVVLVLCALICALALYSTVSCFLRGPSQPRPSSDGGGISEPDQKPAAYWAFTLPYTALVLGLEEGTGAWVAAECAICLTEFEEGEEVSVLERCRHAFHVACIERWLCSRSSCPNCRTSCFPPMDSSSSSSYPSKRTPEPTTTEQQQYV